MNSPEDILLGSSRKSDFGGEIVTLTLNRPAAMNSFSRELIARLGDEIRSLIGQKGVRFLILTGNGRAFSTGADLKERAGMSPEEVRHFLESTGKIFRELEETPFPTLAAINGYALGGGLELALCCDFRIAADDAQLGLTETSLGIIPGAGGTQRLTRLIGIPSAKEMVLTARRITSEKAKSIGLLHSVAAAASLLSEANALADEICRNAPIALAQAKKAIDMGYDCSISDGLNVEREAYKITIPTQDRLEALKAFQEKRRPVFIGE